MNTYEIRQSALVEYLINTYDTYLDEPEHLRQPADLDRFLRSHHIKPEAAVTQSALDEVRSLRHQLRACWTAKSVGEMVSLLNPLLGQAVVIAQVESDVDNQVHLRFEPQPEITLTQRLAVECAMGIVVVLQQHGIERMRACAAEPCCDVFVDTSRNKSRRFCSERCANRYNIAAFRERQKNEDE